MIRSSRSAVCGARTRIRAVGVLVVAGLLDAQLASADEPGVLPAPGLEEPGLRARLARGPQGWWGRRAYGPRMELSYRTFSIADQGGRDQRYHCFAIERYFISSWLRAAGGFEGGFDSTPRGDFLIASVIRAGLQRPARVTLALESVFGFGVVRREILHQDLYGFAWHAGVDGGASVFVSTKLFLSFALGWRRFIVRYGESEVAGPTYVFHDSLSLRVGLGF